jgi:TonB family protein
VAPLERFFYPPDHPQGAQGQTGTTGVRLTVGPNGRVTGCTITRSSGSRVLDSTTCRLLVARARFTPARDSAGMPMDERYDGSVSWPPIGSGMASNVSPPNATDARDPRDRPARRAAPRGSIQGLFRPDDYPSVAVRAGAQGQTAVALTVGADGRTTGCRVTGSSGTRSLDNAACSVVRSRARFTPAIGSDGNPTEDVHETHVEWTLPASAAIQPRRVRLSPRLTSIPMPRGNLQGLFRRDDYPSSALASGASGLAAVRLAIGADGRVTGCSVTRSTRIAALDNATCSVLRARARFTPAGDSNGMPVTGTHDAVISWTPPPGR